MAIPLSVILLAKFIFGYFLGVKRYKFNVLDNPSSLQRYDTIASGVVLDPKNITRIYNFNPLSPQDAINHFTSLKTYLIFLQLRVLEQKFP